MATYLELSAIASDAQWNDLHSKIKVACLIKAAAIIDSATPGATALEWARSTTANATRAGEDIAGYVIASNSAATIAQIYGASDTVVQDKVNAAVDAIYGT